MFGISTLINRIDKLSEKLASHNKQNNERLIEIEKVLVRQEANLQEHMKRSDNLEKMLDNIEKKDLKPLQRHVAMVEGSLKLIGIIGILTGIVVSLIKLF